MTKPVLPALSPQVVVNALFASIPSLGNVLLVCGLFYLIAGIMAVNLFGVSPRQFEAARLYVISGTACARALRHGCRLQGKCGMR